MNYKQNPDWDGKTIECTDKAPIDNTKPWNEETQETNNIYALDTFVASEQKIYEPNQSDYTPLLLGGLAIILIAAVVIKQ